MKHHKLAAKARIPLLKPLSMGFHAPQSDSIRWLKNALEKSWQHTSLNDRDPRQLRSAHAMYDRLLAQKSIESRSSVLADYAQPEPDLDSMTLFRERGKSSVEGSDEHPWFAPRLEDRMTLFSSAAKRLAEEAYADLEHPPSYLIQVSCTGYDAPSALQRLSGLKGWSSPHTHAPRLFHLGHMGCYAAIPALSLASDLAVSRNGAVSLFDVELCTLHIQISATAPEQTVIHYLFADGAIRVDCSPAADGEPNEDLNLIDSFETLVPGTEDRMTWTPAANGFHMHLARDVPAIVRESIRKTAEDFLAKNGLSLHSIDRWAVHPGGTRVIQAVQDALDLRQDQIEHSMSVFRQRGNMSSATIPHIWASLAEDSRVEKGELIASLAFGPGLTVTGNLLRKGAPPP